MKHSLFNVANHKTSVYKHTHEIHKEESEETRSPIILKLVEEERQE